MLLSLRVQVASLYFIYFKFTFQRQVVTSLEDAPLVDASKLAVLFKPHVALPSWASPSTISPDNSNSSKNNSRSSVTDSSSSSSSSSSSASSISNSSSSSSSSSNSSGGGRVALSSERSRYRQTTVGALLCWAVKNELGAEVNCVHCHTLFLFISGGSSVCN